MCRVFAGARLSGLTAQAQKRYFRSKNGQNNNFCAQRTDVGGST
jgi:hypothetical protein